MEIFLIWLLLCVAVMVLAARYRRSVLAWLLLSVVLSPLVGLVLLALGPKERVQRSTPHEVGAAVRDARAAMAHRPYRCSV